MSVWDIVASAISEATRSDFTLRNKNPVAGGNINSTFRLEGTDGRRYFLKLNDARLQPLFLAEVAGLEAISATNTLRVPRVIAHGFAVGQTFLILEHLEFRSHGDSSLFGAQLARMH